MALPQFFSDANSLFLDFFKVQSHHSIRNIEIPDEKNKLYDLMGEFAGSSIVNMPQIMAKFALFLKVL